MKSIVIDGKTVSCNDDDTVMDAAVNANIYIPHLCYHPMFARSAKPESRSEIYQGGKLIRGVGNQILDGCNLCLIEIEGHRDPQKACEVVINDNMVITTNSEILYNARKRNLSKILELHPHACLSCSLANGCDRKICSSHISEEGRCCSKFNMCELQKLINYIGMPEDVPPYKYQKIKILDDPLIKRDYNLCVGCLRCVRACSELSGTGAIGYTMVNGMAIVGSTSSNMVNSNCRFCGYCVEVCPTGALTDIGVEAGKREEKLVPCKSNCPVSTNVPEYIKHLRKGEFDEALAMVYQHVPFPGVLSRVCFHPCEDHCRRGQLDEPVGICLLKRGAFDYGQVPDTRQKVSVSTGKRVAVLGAGPAGLSAAYYLRLMGHTVTVYEQFESAGGMLRVGIPEYRLPREVLDHEIRLIEETGVTINTGITATEPESYLSDGFDAVLVATGAHEGKKLNIPGEESEGVVDGVSFLRSVNLGRAAKLSGKVGVIGGGNVATDAARCAVRLGAESVTVFYRRSREEMPAYEEEIEAMVEEGVNILYQTTPKIIASNGDNTLGVEFTKTEPRLSKTQGKMEVVEIEGSEYLQVLDTLIVAIGQRPAMFAEYSRNKEKHNDNSLNGIFIGGDLLTGPKTVIDAIKSGKDSAALIHMSLMGDATECDNITSDKKQIIDMKQVSDAIGTRRPIIIKQAAVRRIKNFAEVCSGLKKSDYIKEANRCLQCDSRFMIKQQVLPELDIIALKEDNIVNVPDKEGVYIIYDSNKEIYQIVGAENLNVALRNESRGDGQTWYFRYEEDQMYTARERQLIQNYAKEHGKMPPGGDEMDELF